MGFFELAGAFLDGFFGSEESITDWIDRFTDSRSATGVALFCKHHKFANDCVITAVIVGNDGSEIASNSWQLPWGREVKEFMGGKKEQFYTFG
ncbi:MAG: hypothetical protein LBU17_10015 [Treponema sp.]|jgi:hypothetical protein|nr:hypothetical protein [Treponema sp.]